MTHEVVRSSEIGHVITVILLAFLYKDLRNAGEVITFYAAVHLVSTWAVQWIADKINAVTLSQSNHGK